MGGWVGLLGSRSGRQFPANLVGWRGALDNVYVEMGRADWRGLDTRLHVVLIEIERELTTVKAGDGVGAGERIQAAHASGVVQNRSLYQFGIHANRLMVVINDVGNNCVLSDVLQVLNLQAELAFAFVLGGVTAVPELRILRPFGAMAAPVLVIFVDEDVDFLLPNTALKDDVLVEYIEAVEKSI